MSSGMNERSRSQRKALVYRLCSNDVLLPAAFVVYAIGMTRGCYTDVILLGPLMKLVDYCCKSTIPVLYMIWPPTVPPRQQLMEEDEDGVHRPTARALASGRERNAWSWKDMVELALLVYALT